MSTQTELTGEELDARAAELNIEGRSSMSADEKREAVAQAEAAQSGGGDTPDDPEVARRNAAADQNVSGENAVPEQRPQAFSVQDPSDNRSELAQRVLDQGDPHGLIGGAAGEAMDQEAYDRADSDAAKKDAAKNGLKEGLMVGNAARVTKGPYEGETVAITRIVEEGSAADLVRRMAGRPEQLYNQPSEVEVTFIGGDLDGARLVLNVEENGLEKQNEAVRGSRHGRRH